MSINKFQTITSKKIPLPSNVKAMSDIIEMLPDYKYAIIYQADKVITAVVENGKVKFSDEISREKIQEIRAFDEQKELHSTLSSSGIKGRIVEDFNGEATDVYDELHLLWGKNCAEYKNGFYKYSEDRGISVILPFKANVGSKVFMKIRNYRHKSEQSNDFYFDDWRMVELCQKEVDCNG